MKYQNHKLLTDAVTLLIGGSISILEDGNVNFNSGQVEPTQSQVTAKIAELELAEPMRLLRLQRNTLLSATDWQATSDRTMTNEQQIYRQQLRDLPENSTPALDDDGQLTGVTWPTVPE